MVYYHDLYTNASLGDYFRVMWHGLPLDLSLAGYLTAIPGILLIASGSAKAEALFSTICGPITPAVPASILQLHENVTIVADEAALALVPDQTEEPL